MQWIIFYKKDQKLSDDACTAIKIPDRKFAVETILT